MNKVKLFLDKKNKEVLYSVNKIGNGDYPLSDDEYIEKNGLAKDCIVKEFDEQRVEKGKKFKGYKVVSNKLKLDVEDIPEDSNFKIEELINDEIREIAIQSLVNSGKLKRTNGELKLI